MVLQFTENFFKNIVNKICYLYQNWVHNSWYRSVHSHIVEVISLNKIVLKDKYEDHTNSH